MLCAFCPSHPPRLDSLFSTSFVLLFSVGALFLQHSFYTSPFCLRMRRLRRVISKQSNTIPASPVLAEGTGAGWPGEQADEHGLGAGAGAGAGGSADSKEGSFLGIDRWPILGRSAQRRREGDPPASPSATATGTSPPSQPTTMHRSSQSFSMPYSPNTPTRDWRLLRDGSKHKRTSSSSVLSSRLPQRLPFTGGMFSSSSGKGTQQLNPQQQQQQHVYGHERHGSLLAPKSPTLHHGRLPSSDTDVEFELESSEFIGYPPGGLEIRNNGLVLRCEQKSPDVCEYTVHRNSAGLRFSDMLAIALVSWAGHVFFRGPALLALLPMVAYLVRSSLQVYQESLVVIRNVGIQTETITLAGFRSVRSFERHQIEDMVIHEALQLFQYRYYMAILPRDPKHSIIIMFPHLLPKLDGLLPVYHGSRRLLFNK
ncbi:hypothetical protein GQ54DRAFT_186011 [Martensiomyces pterosporus]|nr:hypothetical protein GQ54DRAFT_186011 [Martensiomyces pterosporus]